MEWQPISEADLWEVINNSFVRMSFEQKKLWEVIKIIPEKWQEDNYGNEGGGFWVVGIIGKSVIWYNDIEDGFNRSRFNHYGKISDYRCNQDQLEWMIQNILNELDDGNDANGYTNLDQSIA